MNVFIFQNCLFVWNNIMWPLWVKTHLWGYFHEILFSLVFNTWTIGDFYGKRRIRKNIFKWAKSVAEKTLFSSPSLCRFLEKCFPDRQHLTLQFHLILVCWKQACPCGLRADAYVVTVWQLHQLCISHCQQSNINNKDFPHMVIIGISPCPWTRINILVIWVTPAYFEQDFVAEAHVLFSTMSWKYLMDLTVFYSLDKPYNYSCIAAQ